jgi:glycogen synthase
MTLLQKVRWSDVLVQNNISLRYVWPALLLSKPLVIAVQTWITDGSLPATLTQRIKFSVLRRSTSVSISQAIADHIDSPSMVQGNPYDDQVFVIRPEVQRDRDILFVGRLVSAKGAALLVDAVGDLLPRHPGLTATIVGLGPEEAALRSQVARLGLVKQVTFAGPLSGESLAREYNRHRILAVPSIWREPFGIVALEGIACGCVCVASEGGGLKDAIGPCGITFPNGDQAAFEIALETLLDAPSLDGYRRGAAQHLAQFSRKTMAASYLRHIESAARQKTEGKNVSAAHKL